MIEACNTKNNMCTLDSVRKCQEQFPWCCSICFKLDKCKNICTQYYQACIGELSDRPHN
jgi:hypothetical protein